MDLYAELLQQGEYVVLSVLLAISTLINLPKIVSFYQSSKKQRGVSISNAIADPDVSQDLKTHLKEELDTEYFRNIHGVKLGLPMLKATLILNGRVSDRVSFRHVIKLIKLLPDISDINDVSYRVKLSSLDNVMCLYNLVLGALIAIFGFAAFLLFLYSISTNFNLGFLLTGIACVFMGAYMFNDGVAWVSVKHVNKALEEFESKSVNS